jgi:hypothetical protein
MASRVFSRMDVFPDPGELTIFKATIFLAVKYPLFLSANS